MECLIKNPGPSGNAAREKLHSFYPLRLGLQSPGERISMRVCSGKISSLSGHGFGLLAISSGAGHDVSGLIYHSSGKIPRVFCKSRPDFTRDCLFVDSLIWRMRCVYACIVCVFRNSLDRPSLSSVKNPGTSSCRSVHRTCSLILAWLFGLLLLRPERWKHMTSLWREMIVKWLPSHETADQQQQQPNTHAKKHGNACGIAAG